MNKREIFVFGSNLAGRHGKGAALHALRYYGAVYGQGEGMQGNSYAIPTKDRELKTLPLKVIRKNVEAFLFYAACTPDLTFILTPIGCGLAGLKYKQVAPMFKEAPSNVIIPNEFKEYLD